MPKIIASSNGGTLAEFETAWNEALDKAPANHPLVTVVITQHIQRDTTEVQARIGNINTELAETLKVYLKAMIAEFWTFCGGA